MSKKIYLRNVVVSLGFSVIFLIFNFIIVNQGNIVISDILNGIKEIKSICLVLLSVLLSVVITRVGVENIFKYRYWIAFGVFVLCVIFGVNGSSIGVYTGYFGVEDKDVLFGISRSIRSDEFATFTPMTWSQYFDPNGPFSYFSSILRATETDVFLEYGQPVASWLLIYKPFFLGYLFLPIANGMSFFWCGRLIVLFMVSFEFGRRITSDDRPLSAVYAMFVALSPVVQWWFAINGFVEMLIYLQLAILLLDKYIDAEKWGIKIGCAVGITISAGGYALTMYPAWMVSFAYVILGLFIWLFIEKRKSYKLQKGDVFIIAGALIFLGLSMLYVYHMSKDTIEAVMNTVYPGKRVSVGGESSLEDYFMYTSNLWFPFLNRAMATNVCDKSRFLTLFPFPYIIYIIYLIKTKKRDLFCNVIITIGFILLLFCTIGVPEWLAKITFLSFVTYKRGYIAAQYCEILLLFRGISLLKKNEIEVKKVFGWIMAGSVGVISAIVMYEFNRSYYSAKMLIFQIFVDVLIFIGLFYYDNKRIFIIWETCIFMFILLTGILINPFRVGVDSVADIPQLEMARSVVESDPQAIWMVEGAGYPINNALLLKGARTINSTNVYPNLEKWRLLDKENKYEENYNRYAHIMMTYGENEEKFVLLNKDYFSVYVDYEDIRNLEVDYIFSNRDLTSETCFELIDSTGGYYIYRVVKE